LNLSQAAIYLATAPKSNRSALAIWNARAAVRDGAVGEVPAHLRDSHYQAAATIGHGVGYELHELPSFKRQAAAEGMLEEGDVLTLEPGLYDPSPGGYGVRLEDLVHLGAAGPEILTRLPYDLDPTRWG